MKFEISASKRFYQKLKQKTGIDLPEIYCDYKLPGDYNPKDFGTMVMNRFQTNSSTTVITNFYMRLIFGIRVMVANDRKLNSEGEGHDRAREEMKSLAAEVIGDNDNLSGFDVESMNNRQLFHLLMGVADSINPDDIEHFTMGSSRNSNNNRLLNTRYVEEKTGIIVSWCASVPTLDKIQKELSKIEKPEWSSKLGFTLVSAAKGYTPLGRVLNWVIG